MKALHLSAFLFSCFLFIKSINSTTYKYYSNCNVDPQYLYDVDSYSITWNIPMGTTSCILPLNFLTNKNIDVSLTSNSGGSSSTCKASSFNWNCNSGLATSCPVLMYSLTNGYDSGTTISNYGITSLYSDYVKLQYCGAVGMTTTVSLYVYSTSYYWYWSSSWQFIYIGIPIISLSTFILIVVIYICRRNRRNRIQMVQRPLMGPTVAITTTSSGASNNGYQATYSANQPYYYPQQQQTYNNGSAANLPPAYNPPGYNQSGYIQAPPMKQ